MIDERELYPGRLESTLRRLHGQSAYAGEEILSVCIDRHVVVTKECEYSYRFLRVGGIPHVTLHGIRGEIKY